MMVLSRVLGELAAKHVGDVLTGERDCRLIFPGLTESLAVELHGELRQRLARATAGSGRGVPVYLALDDLQTERKPNRSKGWLHYEALTSVRQGSFVTVCMPKVLPKLHDSIRGTGGPIRGLTFTDEWPWKDGGVEAFRFRGAVLDAILDGWTNDTVCRNWIRELIVEGLLPATAPLRDAIRVTLLLEKFLSFEPEYYPELEDVVDKFCFHCGMPRAVFREGLATKDYIAVVERTAQAFDGHRTKNPQFRDYLVREVAPSTFAALEPEALQELTRALDLFLDGALKLGADSGLLAYHGGLGKGSSSASVGAWSALDVERLHKLFGLGRPDTLRCAAVLPKGRGVVSSDGKHVAILEGTAIPLRVTVNIPAEQFVPGDYRVRCRRRQREVFLHECGDCPGRC